MNRSKMAFGTVAAFGLAVVLAGVGDSSFAVACDTSAKTASASASCCSKDKSANAASIEARKLKHMRVTTASTAAGACTRDAAMSASADGCTKSTTTAASMNSGCESAHASAAAAGCEKSTAMAAGAGSCCDSKSAKSAAIEGCDQAETASLKGAVDTLPYGENRRVVLAGTYECGHCGLNLTDECAPMLKTADGKVYPLMDNARVEAMRAAKCANGVEVSGLVRKVGGVKFIDVKSYRAL